MVDSNFDIILQLQRFRSRKWPLFRTLTRWALLLCVSHL